MQQKRKKRRFISMGSCQANVWRLSFYTSKKQPWRTSNGCSIILTGMRIEEVLGLRREDIDTERGCIHIRRAVVHPGQNMPEIKSTKSKAERTIPLPRHLLDELSPKEETGFLLNSYTDLSRENPLSYTEAAKSFKRIQKQCGVEGYTAHDFRDTCATEWRESRISIGLIARLLGYKKN